ncbi:MAG: chloride channel protein [Alphaproteobacteria bacterium]|nr:chloride channel protein [Alphaproteobacteria bacterium]
MQPIVDSLRLAWRRVVRDPSGRMLALGLGAGVVGGLAAGVFDGVRMLIGNVLLGATHVSVASGEGWRLLVFPVLGGMVAGGILQVAGVPRPVGMARLLEGVQLRSGKVSLWEAGFTALSAVVALGTGHSGGREAPVAGLSAGIAHEVGHALQLRVGELRVVVAATAAAAVSASFNTPLGSALLALELILGSFALRYFGPVVAATVVGTLVGQAVLGDRVAFPAPVFALTHWTELVGYLVLGAVCGAAAAGFQLAAVRATGWADRVAWPAPVRGAAAGLVVGILGAMGLNGVMGTGYALVAEVLADPGSFGLPILVALLLGKGLATLATFAGRTGTGLFSPLLVLGALVGVVFGLAVEGIPGAPASAGSYGLVAMGAITGAALRAPLAMILVLFELTGDYAVVPTTMLTLAVALPVASAMGTGALYDTLLASTGVTLHREVPAELRAKTVGDLMSTGFVTVPWSASLHELVDAFGKTRENLVWAVDPRGRYVGAVNVQDVLDALSSTRPQPDLVVALPVLDVSQPASDGIALLANLDVDEAAVVDADGRLVGVLHERSLLAALEGLPV